MTLHTKTTWLRLDGSWGLEELSDTVKDYIQLYGFAYSLDPDLPVARRDEVKYIYDKFPWRGGYSTVNFFNQLFHKIPQQLRPEVKRIQYASPGFIELTEIVYVALTVATLVKTVCSSIDTAHDTYRKIQKGSFEHNLSKIVLASKELELTKKQIAFCENSSKSVAQLIGLTDTQKQLIEKRVQDNPVMKLKMLLSVYRRIHSLAKKQYERKLKITGDDGKEI